MLQNTIQNMMHYEHLQWLFTYYLNLNLTIEAMYPTTWTLSLADADANLGGFYHYSP